MPVRLSRRSKIHQFGNLAAQESSREQFWGSRSTANHVGKLKIGNQVVIGYVWPLKLRHPPGRKIPLPGWRYVGIFIVFSVKSHALPVENHWYSLQIHLYSVKHSFQMKILLEYTTRGRWSPVLKVGPCVRNQLTQTNGMLFRLHVGGWSYLGHATEPYVEKKARPCFFDLGTPDIVITVTNRKDIIPGL